VIRENRDGLSFFKFPNLSEFSDIRHGVFTRNHGRSTGPFRSLNIGYGVGDNDVHVELNRQKISRSIEGKDIVYLTQIHGRDIVVFQKDDKREITKQSPFPYKGDALVSDISGKFLVIQVADCQSVLMYDPVRRVAANVHSGWRGSINNIIGRTVETMRDIFHCDPADIIAGISPSLGPCCAEFINYPKEIPENLWKYNVGSSHFDFWAMSCDQLCDAGLLPENVSLSRICTRCNTHLFFSYRGEGRTGRFASVIGLRQNIS
jgi:YfiH family protein